MIFTETALGGAYILDAERYEDDRGFFARAWCEREATAHGLRPRMVQSNLSFTRKRGTLRGMHYQLEPHEEDKLVRCVRGAVYDVIIDLRPDSATYLQHVGVELTGENHRALFVPAGFAHGLQTLTDDSLVFYQMTEYHAPHHTGGVRWNDPCFGITWPLPDPILCERDATFPDFTRAR